MVRGLIRIRLRTMLLLVPLVGLGLFGLRVYLKGHDEFLWILKVRFGGVETRRAALKEAGEFPIWKALTDLDFSDPEPIAIREQRRKVWARQILPDLQRATGDSDPVCRGLAVFAFRTNSQVYGTEQDILASNGRVMEALHDPHPEVRTAAIPLLDSDRDADPKPTLAALKSAMTDRSAQVHEACARAMMTLGMYHPETQAEIVASLLPWLFGHPDSRVRTRVVETLAAIGNDRSRSPGYDGPDVLASLLDALRDPDDMVRRQVARGLSGSWQVGSRRILKWASRSARIRPAFEGLVSDPTEGPDARQFAALGLFLMGDRDPKILTLMEQAAKDPTSLSIFGQLLVELRQSKQPASP